MNIFTTYRRSAVATGLIIAFVATLANCSGKKQANETAIGKGETATNGIPVFENFAGSQACAGCHQKTYETHLQTAHYRTGQPATAQNIMGSFKPPHNSYSYSPLIKLFMEKRDSGFYQVAHYKGEEKMAMKFDWVIGSGVMGQSFLTWRSNRLYQMPITYFTAANAWSNSPGFPQNKVMIDRPVTARCLECHITYAKGVGGTDMEPETFNRNQIVYGVDCEKCHGPAKQHVDFHLQHPQDTAARHIVNPAQLPRQQQLDMCALCHGGNIEKTTPSFQFTAGNKLADYFKLSQASEAAAQTGNIDVHGNQYGLFTSSKCFKMSSAITCGACHNTHENERGKTALFSQRCMNCHNPADKKMKTASHTAVTGIEANCIDCHMPAQPSQSIAVFLAGEETPRASLLRSHFIGMYPEAVKKFMENGANQRKKN